MSWPFEPDVGMPPRPLYEWTRVLGHDVREVDRGRAVCSCGERQPRHELIRPRVGSARALSREQRAELVRTSRAWRDAHLVGAWPALMERDPDESLEGFAARIEEALDDARQRRDQLADDAQARAGTAIPVIGEDELEAGTRAAVLKHQHQEVCRRLAENPWLRQRGAQTDDDTIRWQIASIGDPRREL